MGIDALSLSVIVNELNEALLLSKITKISQPENDEIIINCYKKGETRKLLICANGGMARIHLTTASKQNPMSAPSFCMLLRKHLINALILNITQMKFERVIDIKMKNSDELGYAFERHLIVELTGKTSNLILTDDNYVVIDILKHAPLDVSRDRWFASGIKYTFFSPQQKIAPDDFQAIESLLRDRRGEEPADLLSKNLLGISRESVNAALYGETSSDPAKISEKIREYLNKLSTPRPAIVTNTGAVPVYIKGEAAFYDSFNAALDEYYLDGEKNLRFREKSRALAITVKNAIARTEKKIALQREALFQAENNEINLQYGNLILSNLHLLKKNADRLETENYYDGNNISTIKLDPLLSPQANAQNYFKKYAKQKKTAEFSKKLIEENTEQLSRLVSISEALRYSAEMSDLEEIYREAYELKLIKAKPQSVKPQPSKFLEYNVSGYKIYAGKNNIQNDYITFKLAAPDDLWLHTKDIHSAHVLIKNPDVADIPDNIIAVAAEITAYFSEARNSGKTVVDYTKKKFVKKPKKHALGFAVYTDYSSLIVLPLEHKELLSRSGNS